MTAADMMRGPAIRLTLLLTISLGVVTPTSALPSELSDLGAVTPLDANVLDVKVPPGSSSQDVPAAPVNGDVAPDSLGSYSRRAVAWIEGTYLTLRPSFGDRGAIYAYHTEIGWDPAASSLLFREGERLDVTYTQFGEVAVPHQSGFIYLITNQHGQHRLITVSRPTHSGEMYGIIATLLAGRGSLLTPIAAPIAFLPIKNIPGSTVGRISPGDANYAVYREHLRRTTDEPFALFLQG